ncbi:MAG: hypothetical protein ACXWWD_13180 [Chitinophagaceae bacterium]
MKVPIVANIGLTVFSIFFWQVACAQVYVEQGTGPQHQAPTVSVYGPDASSKKIPLNRVKGSPFLNDEWQLASLYDENAERINIVPVRLNLATDEFHFIWKEQELVAGDNNKVTAIVFHINNDSSSVGPMFIKNIPELVLNKKPLTAFVRVMNSGKCQLLKYTNRRVYPAEDSLFGTQKRYVFKDVNFYFLRTENKVDKIKKLTSEHFLALIPDAYLHKEWIDKNALNFKKEEDILLFLDYYNAQTDSPIK